MNLTNLSRDEHQAKYPEANKWADVIDQVRLLQDFNDWRDQRAMQHGYYKTEKRPRFIDLIYEYFKIDAKKLDKERRQMEKELDSGK